MLGRSNRLTTELFKEIMEKGHGFHSPFFLLKLQKSDDLSRFGVSVPKKVAKTAVLRNKLRRRVYTVIRNLEDRIERGLLVVLVLKIGSEALKMDELFKEIEKIFVKSGVIK